MSIGGSGVGEGTREGEGATAVGRDGWEMCLRVRGVCGAGLECGVLSMAEIAESGVWALRVGARASWSEDASSRSLARVGSGVFEAHAIARAAISKEETTGNFIHTSRLRGPNVTDTPLLPVSTRGLGYSLQCLKTFL